MDGATSLELAILDGLLIVELLALKDQLDHCNLDTFFLLKGLLDRRHRV